MSFLQQSANEGRKIFNKLHPHPLHSLFDTTNIEWEKNKK